MEGTNPLVYMDVSIWKANPRRMIFELYYDIAPFAAENFHALCTGEKGVSPITGDLLWYKHAFFHDVNPERNYVKGGASCFEYATDGEGVYGLKFPNEPKMCNTPRHHERGLLSIETNDREHGRSHFVITLKHDVNLDRTHMVFGKLVKGFDTLKDIERYGHVIPIRIVDCGEYNDDAEFSLFGDDTEEAGCSSFGRLYEGQLVVDEDDQLMDEDEDRRFKSHP